MLLINASYISTVTLPDERVALFPVTLKNLAVRVLVVLKVRSPRLRSYRASSMLGGLDRVFSWSRLPPWITNLSEAGEPRLMLGQSTSVKKIETLSALPKSILLASMRCIFKPRKSPPPNTRSPKSLSVALIVRFPLLSAKSFEMVALFRTIVEVAETPKT